MTNAPTRRELPATIGSIEFAEVVVPIVPNGLNDRALDGAADIAMKLDLPVRLIHVHHALGSPGDDLGSAAALDTSLTRFATHHPDVATSAQLAVGFDLAGGLIDALEPSSLVVIATAHAGAEDGSFSLAEELAQRWYGVLLMIGPNAEALDLPGPIVVAHDGSGRADEAIAGAVALHGAWRGPLWLVHVVDAATDEKVAALRDSGYSISESSFVRELADELTDHGHRAGWDLVHDEHPASGIVRFVEEHGAALIAATTHGVGEARVFGSVCMQIVRQAPVPVAVMGVGHAD